MNIQLWSKFSKNYRPFRPGSGIFIGHSGLLFRSESAIFNSYRPMADANLKHCCNVIVNFASLFWRTVLIINDRCQLANRDQAGERYQSGYIPRSGYNKLHFFFTKSWKFLDKKLIASRIRTSKVQSLTKVLVTWWSFRPAQYKLLPVRIFFWWTELF